MPESITVAEAKVLINDKFETLWDTSLPQHCKTQHELIAQTVKNCVGKQLNNFLLKMVGVLVVANIAGATSLWYIIK